MEGYLTNIKPGDIVEIRHRLWRVDSINSEILTATNIDVGESGLKRFYIPFESINKAHILLPSTEKIGDSATNNLLTQSFRYSILHGSAPLLSLQRSCVIPTHYQLVPVVMALNKSERVRMLIADDVGLGKTIEAGLITTELMSRNLVSRILVVCPKNLREQWQDALKYYFQIDAEIISSVHRRVLEQRLPPGASPWKHYRHLITSIDYVKKEPTKHQVLEVPWDLVIVDEAHLAAKPHQTGEKHTVSMERYNFIKELATQKHSKHLMFLTATPHNGYTDSYASLLDMLDCGIVSGPISEPKIDREIARNHVCQRRRKDVEGWFLEHDDETNPFPEREQKEVLVELTHSEETEVIKEVEKYSHEILSLANKDDSHKVRITARWVVMHLHKRALSSPFALRISLKNRLNNLIDKIDNKEFSDEQSITPNQAKANALDEEITDELTDEEISIRIDKTTFGSLAALEAEKIELERLIELAGKVTPAKDSKLKKLTSVDGFLDHSFSGYYGPAKIIIFTRYKDTLGYLEKEIPKRLKKTITPHEVVTVYGDLNDAQRKEKLAVFQKLEKGILIATDCISEGINLQHMANQVIHYELPWNPNRLEQRNGRVDRYGQKQPMVQIRTMVMEDTLDAAILKVLVRKARQIREDYGFSPPFFGDDTNVIDIINELSISELPKRQRSIFEFEGDEIEDDFEQSKEIHIDPFDDATIEQIKSESFYGQSDVDLTDIRQRLKETENSIGTQEDFQDFVLGGLKRFGCSITENGDVHRTIQITLSNRLQVPGYSVIERATFDPKVAHENPGTEQLNISHPVVKRLLEFIKNAIFDERSEDYGRTAAITTPDVAKLTALYHFLVRFTVNTKPASVIEEIIPVACNLIDKDSLSQEDISKLLKSQPVPNHRSKEDLLRHLEMALDSDAYSSAFKATVDMHLEGIKKERSSLKERLLMDDVEQSWLEGIDSVEMASSDIISVRLYEPAPTVGVSR